MSIIWDITKNSVEGTLRFQTTTTDLSGLDLSVVYEGDYVNMDAGALVEANRGSFSVVGASVYVDGSNVVQYFDILNEDGVTQSALELEDDDILFYRPALASIQNSDSRTVVVSQSQNGQLDVVLPATTQAVKRGAYKAAYGQASSLPAVVSMERATDGTITLEFEDDHGLEEGQRILVDGAAPTLVSYPTIPTLTGSTVVRSPSYFGEFDTSPDARLNHTATTLLDGSVLILGGNTTFGVVDTNELFTITGETDGEYSYTWGNLAVVMSSPRELHCAVLMTKSSYAGNVFVLGGADDTATILASAEIINPNTLISTPVSNPIARANLTGHELQDGRLIFIGGRDGDAIDDCQVFDPVSGVLVTVASLGTGRAEHASALLPDGRVLVVGGRVMPDDLETNTCEIYDPVNDVWSYTGKMNFARAQHKLYTLSDGRVLAVGGEGFNPSKPYSSSEALRQAELWDPKTGRWQPCGATETAFGLVRLTYLPKIKRLMVNGVGSTAAEYWNPENGEWSRCIAALPSSFTDDIALSLIPDLDNDVVLCFGAGGAVFVGGDNSLNTGGVNGEYSVSSVLDDVTVTLSSSVAAYGVYEPSGISVTLVSAQASTTPGPFTFDTENGLAITSSASVLDEAVAAGKQYTSLKLESGGALFFPDEEGHLVVGFGTSYQTAPIKYLGRFSDSELVIDYSFRFPFDIDAGADVTLLNQKGAYIPAAPEDAGAFYLTPSAAGRVAASAAIDAVVAAGITVNKIVKYPGDRGLGGEGLGVTGSKLSDKVSVWGSDDLDSEIAASRGEE